MNISIYMNDGSAISSIEINDATSEEALTVIKAFGFGENEEKWLYSDNQKIRYRVEELKACQEEIGNLNYECDGWKAKYDAECQQTDILKKTCDDLSKNLKKSLDDFSELKKEYDISLEDRIKLIERLRELSEKFEKGEQE